MKLEQIIINGITVNKLTSEEGMVLTDGNAYGTETFLGVGRSADEFTEITQSEYNEIVESEAESSYII